MWWLLLACHGTADTGTADTAPACARDLHVVAHPDDELLFQSPALLDELAAGDCVTVLYLTSGDSGAGGRYAATREAGVEAAWTAMTGDEGWAPSPVVANQRLLSGFEAGDVHLLFVRLPDGDVTGDGYASTGFESLNGLFDGTIAAMHPLDDATAYTRADLVSTLEAFVDDLDPAAISALDGSGWYGTAFSLESDHADHYASARFVDAAVRDRTVVHYRGYDTEWEPPNVDGDALATKQSAFLAYAAHDAFVCADPTACAPPAEYDTWAAREYALPDSDPFPPGSIVGEGYWCLSPATHDVGAPLGVVPCTGDADQQWTLDDHLTNGDGLCAADTGDGHAGAAPCKDGLAAESWTQVDGTLQVDGLCATAGQPLLLLACDGSFGQQWTSHE